MLRFLGLLNFLKLGTRKLVLKGSRFRTGVFKWVVGLGVLSFQSLGKILDLNCGLSYVERRTESQSDWSRPSVNTARIAVCILLELKMLSLLFWINIISYNRTQDRLKTLWSSHRQELLYLRETATAITKTSKSHQRLTLRANQNGQN